MSNQIQHDIDAITNRLFFAVDELLKNRMSGLSHGLTTEGDASFRKALLVGLGKWIFQGSLDDPEVKSPQLISDTFGVRIQIAEAALARRGEMLRSWSSRVEAGREETRPYYRKPERLSELLLSDVQQEWIDYCNYNHLMHELATNSSIAAFRPDQSEPVTIDLPRFTDETFGKKQPKP